MFFARKLRMDEEDVSAKQLRELKERMELIVSADPVQYHNDGSLKRYLRAFKTVDSAFQAILKTNQWRRQYNFAELSTSAVVRQNADKVLVLRTRDAMGRPIVYIPAKNHNSMTRDLNEMTKFMVYCLEEASKRCLDDVTDTLCIVFDLDEFNGGSMDYQLVKNLIWLLSKHYPERLGVALILNAPMLFTTIWPVVRQWLNENTVNKVTFITSEDQLCKFLNPDLLPQIL